MYYDAMVMVTLPNGIKITGSHEQISKVARMFGYSNPFEGDYYESSTKGLIRISEMDTHHLRNAILKQLREQPDINDKTWRAMIKEYLVRDLE